MTSELARRILYPQLGSPNSDHGQEERCQSFGWFQGLSNAFPKRSIRYSISSIHFHLTCFLCSPITARERSGDGRLFVLSHDQLQGSPLGSESGERLESPCFYPTTPLLHRIATFSQPFSTFQSLKSLHIPLYSPHHPTRTVHSRTFFVHSRVILVCIFDMSTVLKSPYLAQRSVFGRCRLTPPQRTDLLTAGGLL
jgi:hypothetical protein